MLKLNKLVIRFAFLGVTISGLGVMAVTALPEPAAAFPQCTYICEPSPTGWGWKECDANPNPVWIGGRWTCVKANPENCRIVENCGFGVS